MDMKIIIGASVNHALNAFNSLKAKATSTASNIKAAFSSVNSMLGMVGIGLGIGQIGKYVNHLSDIAKAADNLDLGTDEFQKLSYAAERSGLGTEKLKNGLHAMRQQIGKAKIGNEEAARSFRLLNISIDSLNGKSTLEQFNMIRAGLDKIADNDLREKLAGKIFADMGKEFQVFARDVDSLMGRAEKISLIDEEDLRNAEKLADMFDDIGSAFFTALTKGASLVKDIFTGDLFSDPQFQRRQAAREFDGRMGKLDKESRSTDDYKNIYIEFQKFQGMKAGTPEFEKSKQRLDDLIGKLETLQDIRQERTTAAQFDQERDRQYKKIGPMNEDEQKKFYGAKNIGELDKAVSDITKDRKKAEEDLQKAIKEATKRLEKDGPLSDRDKEAIQGAKSKEEIESTEKAITGQRKIEDQGDDLEKRLKRQQLILAGKEREAAIQDEIDKAEKIAKEHGTELTPEQRQRIEENAGKLYDATHQPEPTRLVGPENKVFTDSLLRMGGMIGNINNQSSTRNYDKIQAEKLTSVESEIKQIYEKLPNRTEYNSGDTF